MVPANFQRYLSAGKPILAIANGEVADLVHKHKVGLVAEPDDLSAISALYERCIRMSDLEKQVFHKKNHVLLTNIFDKEKIIDSLFASLLRS